MGWVVNATPRPLYPLKRPGTHCIGGWVGPRAGMDRRGKSHPHRDSITGHVESLTTAPQLLVLTPESMKLKYGNAIYCSGGGNSALT